MLELVDNSDLESEARKGVWVRIPLDARDYRVKVSPLDFQSGSRSSILRSLTALSYKGSTSDSQSDSRGSIPRRVTVVLTGGWLGL